MGRGQLIRSFRDVERLAHDRDTPIVTLFSGGLDSSYLLYRLAGMGFSAIHAVSVDIGGDDDVHKRRHIAEGLGAELHMVDARSDFVESFVAPALSAHSVYLDTHPVSSSLSRPLIARVATEVAQAVDAKAILHTANRSQNTLRRLNGALEQLGFGGDYGSPYDVEPVDRVKKMAELKSAGLGVLGERSESGDSNLWCREFESGILDDPESHEVPSSYYQWTALREGVPAEVSLRFASGRPVALGDEELPLGEIVERLNWQVGAFGIGRYTGLEHLKGGQKVLEIREMPAAALLLRSRRHLETATLQAETIREKLGMEQIWVREALEGRWFGELRAACQAFIDVCAERVSGTVRWKLSPGGAETTAIVADDPLYLRDREDWETRSIMDEVARLR
ncbi:argininosuccinate synthase [Streptomyces sp. NWU49]|uniref:argininosuccinate synthase-related protein n=1 Tax=Streptomyces sp. NWU49 TaxID=2201153 RepID=UPI000D678297|nr:argininosuccinate synthase-related protein [Streptomyces sp. NWU49]PWJ02366.1 argininosuccinate synthase [Streptomyces sp. NWU49]